MKILLLCHSFNSLAQRVHVALREAGHHVAVELDVHDALTLSAAERIAPDAIVAPFLKRRLPETIWRRLPCFILHPGPPGDRGPSALDWAIQERQTRWGVTLLQADGEYDAGPVWGFAGFDLREDAAKGSIYRFEVADAAVPLVLAALDRLAAGGSAPGVPAGHPCAFGRPRPPMAQADRAIDWAQMGTSEIAARIRAADGMPGVRDRDAATGRDLSLFAATPAPGLSGPPGAWIARSGTALARATVDGAIWIGQLKDWGTMTAADRQRGLSPLKLPATSVLVELAARLPVLRPGGPEGAPQPLRYEEYGEPATGAVGVLRFAFHNGAMGIESCRALLSAWHQALARPTRVLVLAGGPEFFSNGLDLAEIEAAASPADASLANIEAMDDLCAAILTTTDRLTIAALHGNAGAGGVFLALGADEVWAREGVVLNPHYRGMGNLYGSEYWTYVLPRRSGSERAAAVTGARLPMGVAEALRLGLVDAAIDGRFAGFDAAVIDRALALAGDAALPLRLAEKARRRATDEAEKPLAAYRAEELTRMRRNFYGFDTSYHIARAAFIRKEPKSRTPSWLKGGACTTA